VFGVAELLRNSPNYQRSISNLGYYTTVGDYADVKAWADFRSGARRGRSASGGRASTSSRATRTSTGSSTATSRSPTTGSRRAAQRRTSWQHAQAFNQNRRFTPTSNLTQNTLRSSGEPVHARHGALGTIASNDLQDRVRAPVSASTRRLGAALPPGGRSASSTSRPSI
jgi:hypothetical protein